MMKNFNRKHFTRSLQNRHRGVALVTALLIVSLATIMAVALSSRQYVDVRRTSNIMLADQAYLYSVAMENFAGQLLAYSREKLQLKYDDPVQFAAAMAQFSAFPVDGGSVAVSVIYPEARFNVNNLINNDGKPDEVQQKRYRRLLVSVLEDLEMSTALADILVPPLLDWLDADEDTRLDGAEDGIYESRDIPYKAANQMMTSISEMRLVEGYTTEILDGRPGDEENEAIPGLLNYLTALPDNNTTLNINLVDENNAKQFVALSTHIDELMARELLVGEEPYEQLDDFKSSEVFSSVEGTEKKGDKKELLADLAAGLDVQSSYFMLRADALVGQTQIKLNSLVYVNTDGTKFEVISRSIGTDGL